MSQNIETHPLPLAENDDQRGPHAPPPPMGRAELFAAFALAAVLLVLRIVYAQHFRVDSDEPQHLHVVWGWANGLLQYRDIFDNHSPLFQMLCAPLFRLFGERADIILPMRQAMLPLFLFDVWCIYQIARQLGSRRFAIWSTLAASCYPTFFLISTEFRTDDLWVALWLLALVLVTGGEFKGKRAFWTGLVLGAAFSVSMKTSMLVVCLLFAGIMLFVVARRLNDVVNGKQYLAGAGIALLAMAIIPAAVVAFFAAKGALPQMYYGIIEHNTALGTAKLHKFAFKRFWFPLGLIILPMVGYFVIRGRRDRRAAYRQVLLLLCAGFYYNALRSFWPLITAQDYLPFAPVAMLGIAPAVAWLARRSPPWTYAATGAILAGEMVWLIAGTPPWNNRAAGFIQGLGAVLRLTNPTDYVMDGKGETIFRKRPFYYALEGVTMARMRMGLIEDDLQQRLIDTKTCVLIHHRLPKADNRWVDDNYVSDADKIWVAGKLLGKIEPAKSFTLAIPGTYSVVNDYGKITGTLDGQPIDQPQFLAAGPHTLQVTSGEGRVAVIWTQAVERGYSIFNRVRWTPK